MKGDSMKILETTFMDPEGYEGAVRYELLVNEKPEIRVGYICPEDATFNRDLSFVYSIPALMKMAYEAGKNGEEFSVESKEELDE